MQSRPLPFARLVAAAGLLALLSPVVLAKVATAPSAATTDNAPFWTGRPDAAQFKARNEKRLVLAKAALGRLLAVKGTRTIANTLVPFDEISRQLDMAGSQSVGTRILGPRVFSTACRGAPPQEFPPTGSNSFGI